MDNDTDDIPPELLLGLQGLSLDNRKIVINLLKQAENEKKAAQELARQEAEKIKQKEQENESLLAAKLESDNRATQAEELARQEAEKARQEAEKARQAEELARQAAKVGYLLDYGLPPIGYHNVASTSNKGPSTTKVTLLGYDQIVVEEINIGIPSHYKELARKSSSIWNQVQENGSLGNWSHENKIAGWVETYLRDIKVLAGLDKQMELYTEVSFGHVANPSSVASIRCDILIFKYHGIAIGICEVKKPSNNETDLGIVNEKIQQQITNYLLHLHKYQGVRYAFGILTTYKEWRICCLRNAREWAESTALHEDFIHGNSVENIDVQQIDVNGTQSPVNTAYLCMSPVYKYDNKELTFVLVATLYKMFHSPIDQPESIIKDAKVHGRKFCYAAEGNFKWETLPNNLTENKLSYELPTGSATQFYLIQDFHGGRDGHVWLSMIESGKLAVLKIAHNAEYEEEANYWRNIWGQKRVRTFKLVNDEVLMMPFVFRGSCEKGKVFFRPAGLKWATGECTVDDIKNSEIKCNFDESLEIFYHDPMLTAKTAIRNMAEKGFEHNDLEWRHVGLMPLKKERKTDDDSELICSSTSANTAYEENEDTEENASTARNDSIWEVVPILIDLHDIKTISTGEVSINQAVECGIQKLGSNLEASKNS